jgi:hypothetical protein
MFLQGGVREIRVVALTPPIDVRASSERMEATWARRYRPLRYSDAPLLIDNAGSTDFPAVLSLLSQTNRTTFCGAAGSRFRSRTAALPVELAKQIQAWFKKRKRRAIQTYADAICSSESGWHRHARAQGWVAVTSRQAEYVNSTRIHKARIHQLGHAQRRC